MKLGIDVLVEQQFSALQRMRVGLVSNSTGVDSRLVPTWRRLFEASGVKLAALFGPEHGWEGAVQDALDVASSSHPFTKLPIYSLYDEAGNQVKPTERMLKGLDALLFDIQDVGVRFYTYIYTMAFCMEACARVGLPFIVLDRPNPITGSKVGGNVLDPIYQSFLGRFPIALRHGMTVAELARLFNEQYGIGCDLTLIPLEGWPRDCWYDETSLMSWVMPSPNVPTLETAAVYPGTCLFEGTNVSEGRGTTRPFELIGAPWIEGLAWADALNALDLPGVMFRPATFIPTFWKYAGQSCSGVQVHVADRRAFEPVTTGLHMVQTVKQLHRDDFAWRPDPGATRQSGITPWFFDLLFGTDTVRLALEADTRVDDIVAGWDEQLQTFKKHRSRYLLYG